MTTPFKYVPLGSKSEYSWVGELQNTVNPNYDPSATTNINDVDYDITKIFQPA